MKYQCPCCEYYTYTEKPEGKYDICPVCFWEDDPIQFQDVTYRDGANRVSLKQAKLNFKKFGASDKVLKQYVRKPNMEECE